MTDIDALVSRLRDELHLMQRDGLGALIETGRQAADALAALESQLKVERALSDRLEAALYELVAVVKGESPGLLTGDGSDHLAMAIKDALQAHTAAREEPHD